MCPGLRNDLHILSHLFLMEPFKRRAINIIADEESWGFLYGSPLIHMASPGKYQILIQTQAVVRMCVCLSILPTAALSEAVSD